MVIKKLVGYSVIKVGGMDVLNFTYEEVDGITGRVINQAVQEQIKIVNPELAKACKAVEDFLDKNLINAAQ